ncbi:MAG: FAD-binding protein [Cypionkella sp.]|uniref:FAD-binding protein n=1 Tax=Cypionkella sp. TaxID=2811411 RepID=UPI00260B9B94|nr:FAD-binding protein [Cypionkella sp.]MDB5658683.1 FAD-binding protein [Cypionkella sp.]
MKPASESELSEMIRGARAFLIQGGGTRRIGQTVGELLETSALAGVELYEPGALTLIARAGTPLAEVQTILAAERQRLAFEVPDLRKLLDREGTSTIGGVVAANASGPRRVQVGACRDALLGVRFVDGTGAIVKNGGRVMKNVTGYDLVKLMAGSQGVLGVLTEVSFKVQAVPEAEVTLMAERSLPQGLADLRAALGSPYDISGAAWIAGRAMIRLEGMAGSVAYRAGKLRDLLAFDTAEADWSAVRDVTLFAGRPGAVWRVSVKPTEAAPLIARLGLEAVCDWGGGLVWLLDPTGTADVRAALSGNGHATLMRTLPGAMSVPVFQPESLAVAKLTAGLRAKFDPRGVFNPGMMG